MADDDRSGEDSGTFPTAPPGTQDPVTYMLGHILKGVNTSTAKVDEYAETVKTQGDAIEKHGAAIATHLEQHDGHPLYTTLGMALWKWPKSTCFCVLVIVAVGSNPNVQALLSASWKWFLK